MSARGGLVRPLAAVIGLGFGVALSATACGTDGNDGVDGDAGSGGVDADGSASGGRAASGGDAGLGGGGLGGALPAGAVACDAPAACGLVECETEEAEADHVVACSELSPHTNPPTSGPHYPDWAQFGIYDEPFPRGFLMHTLEHSAVALLYNCTLVERSGGSCEELVAQLEAFYADYPDDPLCTSVRHRLLVIPDPLLDVPFAATAWGGHLKGECFDADRVRAFVDAHYGMTYENICYAGIDPLAQGCD
jgi:hypothetical protein